MLKETAYMVTRNSTGEQLREKLYTADNVPMVLTGCSVSLLFLDNLSLDIVRTVAATIEDAPNGVVSYTWVSGDWTALPEELYIRKWRVTKPSSAVVFVPSDRNGYETRIISAGT